LLCRFHQLLPARLLAGWLAVSEKLFYQRAFTPLVTLWYMIFQRLNDNHHLSRVQEDAREGGADRLSPKGKPLSAQLTSESTSAYSDARQRLPLQVCLQTLWRTAAQIGQAFQLPQWFGFQVALMDGSTYRLRPFGDIPGHFEPHRSGNSKKPAYWCVARVVGLLCLATGAVLDSAVGSLKTSEQALSASMLQRRCWAGWLLLADRNFGVYSVARAIVAAQGQGLLRLSQVRANKLARDAGCKLRPGLDALVNWSPTRHDQCPEGLARTPVQGRLLVVRIQRPGFRSFLLYLFTTLTDPVSCPAQQLAQLYAQRWNIEVCFRYIKAQMDLGFLECHSADIARKEWLAGLIAYNLIRWTMASAAAVSGLALPRLSFSRARELLLGWLGRSPQHHRSTASWQRLLARISKALQPKRRKRRPSEPRAIRAFNRDVAKLVGSRAAARKKLAQKHAKS
jgi:putative transposase